MDRTSDVSEERNAILAYVSVSWKGMMECVDQCIIARSMILIMQGISLRRSHLDSVQRGMSYHSCTIPLRTRGLGGAKEPMDDQVRIV